jgi:hypothetical protein
METLSVMDEHWAVEMCASVHALIAWRGRGSAPQREGWGDPDTSVSARISQSRPAMGMYIWPEGITRRTSASASDKITRTKRTTR